jgi:hypothetical protein
MTYSTEAAISVSMPSVQRDFIRVDLSNYEERREEITKTLMKAATDQGFFYGKTWLYLVCIFNSFLFYF